MSLVQKILDIPFFWNLSQTVFGCDSKKRALYRSAVTVKGRFLDFGCADGNTFPAFSDFEYYGIDINKTLIDYASRKYVSYKNARFINADILLKPFEKEYFDIVLFACTGHHLEEKLLFKIMDELAYVIKPGGRLYYFDTIRDPGKDSLLLRFLISLDQGKYMKTEKWYEEAKNKFSERLKVVSSKTMKIKGTFMPQPTYFVAEFVKV